MGEKGHKGTYLDPSRVTVDHECVEKIEDCVIERANRIRFKVVVGRDGSVLRRRRALTVEADAEDLHTGTFERTVRWSMSTMSARERQLTPGRWHAVTQKGRQHSKGWFQRMM